MKTIKISKVYRTFEEFENSPEFNEMWERWQGKRQSIAAKKKVYKEFYGCYVEPIEPSENYGRSFRLYNHYKTDEGHLLFMEQKIHSMIALSTLSPVYFGENEISIGEPICSNSDRKQMREICELGITLY